MDYMLLAVIGEGVIIVGLIIALIVICVKNKAISNKADNVKIINGVRYSKEAGELIANGKAIVTHKKNDIVLEVGMKAVAKKDSAILPGNYVVLTATEGVEEFNVRMGGLVRNVKHASTIVLADGDEITAVSHTIILR